MTESPAVAPPPFVGAIPAAYEQFLVPVLFQPWATLVAERAAVEAPGRVLELAAGTGVGTRALCAGLPDAQIVATDLSADMLDRAAAAAPGSAVSWQPADAQELPFADDDFDLVVIEFGIMFVPDRARAYGEMRRTLRDGGALVMTVWDSPGANRLASALDAGVIDLIPDNPPTVTGEVAFGHHDPELIVRELTGAGFTHVVVERLTRTTRATAAQLARGFGAGTPLHALTVARGFAVDDMVASLHRSFQAQFGADSFDLPMTALLITAH